MPGTSAAHSSCGAYSRRTARCHDHVLAIEISRFTFGDKESAVLKRLSALEYPVHLFIVNVGSSWFKHFRKTIKRLGIEPLAIH